MNDKNKTENTAWSLYCASDEVPTEADGDIVKTVLRTGTWRYSPGPGQKPIAVPLNVIEGHAADPQKEVGMSDLVEAFKDGAIEHVTIPLSHEDNVHENTGYVKDLFVDDDPNRPGQKRLRAKFKFTDPEIQTKVKNGSIANTSAGMLFDYIRKNDGKIYPIALAHVALTNHPWINGMEPFSDAIAASEELDQVVCLVLDEKVDLAVLDAKARNDLPASDFAVPSERKFPIHDLNHARNALARAAGTSYEAEVRAAVTKRYPDLKLSSSKDNLFHLLLDDPQEVEDDPQDQELWDSAESLRFRESSVSGAFRTLAGTSPNGGSYWVRDLRGDTALVTNETNDQTFVVPFAFNSGSGQVTIAPSTDWVAAKQEWIAASEALGATQRVTETVTEKPQKKTKPNGGNSMTDVLDGLELSDENRQTLERALDAQKEVDRLRAEARKREVDDRVEVLKSVGFSEQPDLLAYVRDVLLSDTGSTVLNLSQDGKSDKTLTASDVLDGFIELLPKKDGKVNLGEQATNLGTSEERPAVNAENENKVAKADRVAAAEAFLYSQNEED